MRLLSLPIRRTNAVAITRPIRVCFVIDRLSRAGTETQLLALLRDLDRDYVLPYLCLLNGGDTESRSLLPANCPVLDIGLRSLASAGAIRSAFRLAAFWRRHRIDVLQTYFLDSTYFAAPLARLFGIGHVVRVRNNAGYWLTKKHRMLGRVVGRVASLTLTNSDDARQALVDAERLPADRVRIIENGVDVERFRAIRSPDTAGATVRIGAIANLRAVKNIDGLIRVAAEICRDDPRVLFEVAGHGPLYANLQEQIRVAGLDGRFILRGSVVDVPGFLATLDIAVLPSHSESMSNALLEYMAAGRTIVATDVGANARLVRSEREGLIVPAANDEALASAIRRLLSAPRLAQSLGAAARERAATEFSRAAMVRRFEEFYVSLFNDTARGGPAGRRSTMASDS